MQNRSGLLVRLAACVAAAAWVGLVPAAARAYDFVDLATYTPSATHVVGHLCALYSGTDLSCASTNPYVDSSGLVGIGTEAPAYPLDVSGTLRATRFIGDGSGLTGLPAANVSVTTGSSGSIVFRDAYGSLVASSGFSISSTTGSVGIGAGAPSWIGNNGLYAAGNGAMNSLNLSGGNSLTWKDGSVGILGNTTNQYLAFTASGTEAMRIVSTGFVGIGTSAPSSTLHIKGNTQILALESTTASPVTIQYYMGANSSGKIQFGTTTTSALGSMNYDNSTGRFSWYTGGATTRLVLDNGYGLGVLIGNATPSTTLHVSGTIRMADGGEACDSNRKGAIKYASGEFYICRNGTAWESLTSVANNATPDRLVSGTASAILNPDGTLATQNLTAWGAGITALQVGNVSASQNITVRATLTAATSIGIGTTSPSAPLDVSGAIKISGDGAEGCTTTADEGKIRWNPTRKRFQLCVH